jgi:hypothetical protein
MENIVWVAENMALVADMFLPMALLQCGGNNTTAHRHPLKNLLLKTAGFAIGKDILTLPMFTRTANG